MDQFAADYLANLTAELTGHVIHASGKRLRVFLQGTEEEQALQRAIRAGIAAMLAVASHVSSEEMGLLEDIFRRFFEEEDVAREIADLLRGRKLDREEMRFLFAEAGFDEETLPGLDFGAGLDAFEAAFLLAVTAEPDLREILSTGQLLEQTQLQREALSTLQQLVDFLKQAGDQTPITVTQGSVVALEGSVAGGPHSVNIGGHVYGGVTIVQHFSGLPAKEDHTRAYLERVRDICNVLPLSALGGEEDTDESIRLDQVYIALDTTTEISPEKIDREGVFSRGSSRKLSALEAATRHKRMVLLGKPGSGKSTFVRQLAAQLAEASLERRSLDDGWEENLLPVLTSLRELASRLPDDEISGLSQRQRDDRLIKALWDYWQYDLNTNLRVKHFEDQMDARLQEGQVVLIFDGLDEVTPALRKRVRETLEAVQRRYPRIERILVTSRIRSYTRSSALPGFDVYTLAPFDEDKIKAFVQAWYRAQNEMGRMVGKDKDAFVDDLQKAALSQDLQEMAENPMLLTVMAIIHHRETRLPKQRVMLYDEAVKVLILRWQRHKGIAPVALKTILADRDKLRGILERIAYEFHELQAENGREAQLTRGFLLTMLDEPQYLDDLETASQFLDYVDQRAGILIGYGGDEEGGRPLTYDFAHRTFQEYLAGSYMVGRRDAGRKIIEKAKDGDFWYVAVMLGAEELLYIRRVLPNLLDLAYDFCPPATPVHDSDWRIALWSGQIAAQVGLDAVEQDDKPGGGKAYLECLIPRLVALLEGNHLSPIERADAGNVLARLGDPRPGVGLNEQGIPDIRWSQVIQPGPFIMGNTKETDPMAYDDEAPQFTCNLITKPYRISVYPITVAQYQAFIKERCYETDRYWTDAGWEWRERRNIQGPEDYGEPFNLSNHPQVGVSWYEAVAFCNWLSEKTGLTISLPTEPQWERAARHTDGRRYPWSPEPQAVPDPNRMNYRDTGIGATSAVGVFPAGRAVCEAEDMSGNVWEWTRSLWGKDIFTPEFRYPYGPFDGRENLDAGDDYARVVRGGSFNNGGGNVRAAIRDRGNPGSRSRGNGFRVVFSPFTTDH